LDKDLLEKEAEQLRLIIRGRQRFDQLGWQPGLISEWSGSRDSTPQASRSEDSTEESSSSTLTADGLPKF
jgi:hypothetical protein